jgi:hypothetical protein
MKFRVNEVLSNNVVRLQSSSCCCQRGFVLFFQYGSQCVFRQRLYSLQRRNCTSSFPGKTEANIQPTQQHLQTCTYFTLKPHSYHAWYQAWCHAPRAPCPSTCHGRAPRNQVFLSTVPVREPCEAAALVCGGGNGARTHRGRASDRAMRPVTRGWTRRVCTARGQLLDHLLWQT